MHKISTQKVPALKKNRCPSTGAGPMRSVAQGLIFKQNKTSGSRAKFGFQIDDGTGDDVFAVKGAARLSSWTNGIFLSRHCAVCRGERPCRIPAAASGTTEILLAAVSVAQKVVWERFASQKPSRVDREISERCAQAVGEAQNEIQKQILEQRLSQRQSRGQQQSMEKGL